MINRNEFMSRYPNITEGMTAYSEDGEKLGKVQYLDDDSITVEKGLFFPKDFTFRYDDVVDIRGGDLIINSRRSDLESWKDESYAGWDEYDRAAGYDRAETRSSGEDVSIPVTEERLEAQKTAREKGEVRIRKVVHSEMKNLSVPVQKEEVFVERVPVSGDSSTAARGEENFSDEEIRIPIVEEEAEIVKRPVVKEEVRVHKDTRTEQEEFSGEVRKTDVEIDREGETGKRGKPAA